MVFSFDIPQKNQFQRRGQVLVFVSESSVENLLAHRIKGILRREIARHYLPTVTYFWRWNESELL
ncbi:MAG TPA: hypothetical protein DCZ56_04350 [Sutterella sp.]|nr:hypothetical protein [Sutterella sp.]